MKRKMQDMETELAVDPTGAGQNGVPSRMVSQDEDAAIDMDRLLCRKSPFANETGTLSLGEFEPGPDLREMLEEARILVVGAGGLGCEMLKNLALSGVKNIDVIDMDTIELSNLNRQFLFREKDIGRPKAVVAAEFIMERVPGVKVIAHHCTIQEKPAAFYEEFSVVIAGLDNIRARIWLNSMLFQLAEKDPDTGEFDLSTVKPLIDGGTEGFQGQARVIIPGKTACFSCTLALFPQQQGFQLCTIADTPRQPEHCIAYAQILQWPQAFPSTVLDADNPEHVTWVLERATQRADKFNISGVTYRLTLGVIKNIIPAIASTNAIVAAVSVNEAIKVLTAMSQTVNNYMMYQGPEGVYTFTTAHERREDCLVCGSTEVVVTAAPTRLLRDFISDLKGNPQLQLAAPSVTTEQSTVYMQKPPSLEAATRKNLDKALGELVSDGEVLSITDPTVQGSVAVVVKFAAGDGGSKGA